MATTPVFLPRKPMDRGVWRATIQGSQRVKHSLETEHASVWWKKPQNTQSVLRSLGFDLTLVGRFWSVLKGSDAS